MKITFLVMGAIAPRILHQTCRLYSGKKFSFIVHVDRKVDFEAYRRDVGDWPHLTFVETRYEVYWAGFSMIDATNSLVKQALASSDSDHFALISDDTFPLLPPDSLHETILGSKCPWIETWQIPEGHLFQQRYSKFYYFDSRFSSARWVLTEERAYSESDRNELLKLEILRTRGKKKIDRLYAGKQWWILRRKELSDIYNLGYKDEHLVSSFKFSAVSDETYFQTLFRIIFPDDITTGNPMLDDFSREPKPYVISNYDDLLALVSANESQMNGITGMRKYLFVRKMSNDAPELVEKYAARW